jgi:hypothetical protein
MKCRERIWEGIDIVVSVFDLVRDWLAELRSFRKGA